MTILEDFHAANELVFQRALNSETPLSWEMTRLLMKVIYAGYELFPFSPESPRTYDPAARAGVARTLPES